MPVTAYCKKCGQDVPVSETCPLCGRSLPKSARRVAWCLATRPSADWMCWNSAARVIIPAAAAVLVIVLLVEAIAGGMAAVEKLLTGGLITTVMMLLALIAFLLMIILRLQGDSVIDCILDSKGAHVQEYVPNPTPLKMMLRLRAPSLLDQTDWDCDAPMVLVSQREIAWRDITRVQLWPEKQLILLYAPHWWMRIAIYATPQTWNDALCFIHEKIGKKKSVSIPREMTLYMEQAAVLEQEQLQMELPDDDSMPPAPDFTEETAVEVAPADEPDLLTAGPAGQPETIA